MAEYNESICRSCLHSYVCEKFNEHRDSYNQKCHFYNDHFVPAADVAPVRHGRNINAEWPSLFECSVCGWSDDDTTTGDTTVYNYCPNCGAKMDLEG